MAKKTMDKRTEMIEVLKRERVIAETAHKFFTALGKQTLPEAKAAMDNLFGLLQEQLDWANQNESKLGLNLFGSETKDIDGYKALFTEIYNNSNVALYVNNIIPPIADGVKTYIEIHKHVGELDIAANKKLAKLCSISVFPTGNQSFNVVARDEVFAEPTKEEVAKETKEEATAEVKEEPAKTEAEPVKEPVEVKVEILDEPTTVKVDQDGSFEMSKEQFEHIVDTILETVDKLVSEQEAVTKPEQAKQPEKEEKVKSLMGEIKDPRIIKIGLGNLAKAKAQAKEAGSSWKKKLLILTAIAAAAGVGYLGYKYFMEEDEVADIALNSGYAPIDI